jgi:hypothetical protein
VELYLGFVYAGNIDRMHGNGHGKLPLNLTLEVIMHGIFVA